MVSQQIKVVEYFSKYYKNIFKGVQNGKVGNCRPVALLALISWGKIFLFILPTNEEELLNASANTRIGLFLNRFKIFGMNIMVEKQNWMVKFFFKFLM